MPRLWKKPIYVTEALKIFEEDLAIRELSQVTRRGYFMDSHQFHKWLSIKSDGPVLVQMITKQHIVDFIHYLKEERQYRPRSINRKLNTLSTFFECLKKNRIVQDNPLEVVERMKIVDSERIYLNAEEVEAIIHAIDHKVLHYFAMTMAYSGIRVTECIHLKLKDIHFTEKYIQVINGKGGKNRRIPLNTKLAAHLKIYLEEHRPQTDSLYFFALKKTGTVSVQYVNMKLNQAAKKADIKKHVTSHILRHSFASHLIVRNTHIAVIQRLLGHASVKTTSIYLHVHQDDLEYAVDQIDFS